MQINIFRQEQLRHQTQAGTMLILLNMQTLSEWMCGGKKLIKEMVKITRLA
jgi:hypothetical protein